MSNDFIGYENIDGNIIFAGHKNGDKSNFTIETNYSGDGLEFDYYEISEVFQIEMNFDCITTIELPIDLAKDLAKWILKK